MIDVMLMALAQMAAQDTAVGARIVPPATTATFTVTGTFSDGTTGRSVPVTSDQDSDNDGVPDEGELRFTCAGGTVASAVFAPRDAATGQASGKRQHKPMMVTAGAKKLTASYDLATMKGARSTAGSAVTVPLKVSHADDWCTGR